MVRPKALWNHTVLPILMISIDQILIGAYIIAILAIGLYEKKTTNINVFLFSGRKLTAPAFIATLVSTWYGGILEIGRFSNLHGISTWLVFGLFYYIAALLYAKFLAEKISASTNDSIPIRFYNSYGLIPGIFAVILNGLPWLYPPREALVSPTNVADLARSEMPPWLIGTSTTAEYLPKWVQQLPDTDAQRDMLLTDSDPDRLDREFLPPGVKAQHLKTMS